MKRLVLAALILTTAVGASAQFTSTDTLKYRISLTDKAATTYSIRQPEKFLSKKSIDRRLRQKLAIDSTDLPVCKKYVDAIRKKGVHVLVTGKWDNFVTVSCNDRGIQHLKVFHTVKLILNFIDMICLQPLYNILCKYGCPQGDPGLAIDSGGSHEHM